MKLKIITLSLLMVFGTASCVTRTYMEGSDKNVVRNVDPEEAAKTRIALGLNYLKKGSTTQAKYNLDKAVQFAPNLPEAYYSLAFYYENVGEDKLAEQNYEKAIHLAPDDGDVQNNYGAFLCRIGKMDEAKKYFKKAIQIPNYIRVAETYENMAICAVKVNNFDDAEDYLKLSLEHNDARVNSMINLGALYYAKGKYNDILNIIEKIENLAAINARSVLLAYLTQVKLGNMAKADVYAGTLITVYPLSTESKLFQAKRLDRSEFELLRSDYSSHLMSQFAVNGRGNKGGPQIKVTRKPENNLSKKSVKLSPQNEGSQATVKPPRVLPKPPKHQKVEPEFKSESNATIDAQVQVASLAKDDALMPMPERDIKRELEAATADEAVLVPESDSQLATAAVVEPTSLSAVATPKKTVKVQKEELSAQNIAPTNDMVPEAQSAMSEQGAMPEADGEDTLEVEESMIVSQTALKDAKKHIVAAGETLFSISFKYNIKIASLKAWNRLKKDSIEEGQTLYLEDIRQHSNVKPVLAAKSLQAQGDGGLSLSESASERRYHVLQSGENLYRISRKYNIKLQRLIDWNNIQDLQNLNVGDKIYLIAPEDVAND